jgi:hypothetical protein
MKLEPSTLAPLVIKKLVQACDCPKAVSRTIIRRVLILFIGETLLGQKYYFYGLMQKSRLKLLFLQKINQ